MEIAESVLAVTGQELTHVDKARMVSTICGLIGEGSGRANAMRVAQLIGAVPSARPGSQTSRK